MSGPSGLVFEPIAAAIETLVERLADDTILVVDPNCRPSAIADASAYRARLDRILARADVVKVSTADLAYLGVDPDRAGRRRHRRSGDLRSRGSGRPGT